MNRGEAVSEVTKTVPVFRVAGREFRSKAESEAQEVSMEARSRLRCFLVRHNPDSVEGRGFQAYTYLLAPSEAAALQWCIQALGHPVIEFLGGAGAAWAVTELSPEVFRQRLHDAVVAAGHSPLGTALVLDEWGSEMGSTAIV